MRIKTFILFISMLNLASIAHAQARHFCVECHTSQEIASFRNLLAWEKSIYQEKNNLCPSMRRLKEEIYFIESQIVKYAQILDQLEKNRVLTGKMKKELLQQTVAYHEAVMIEPVSQEEITAKTIKIKNKINKVYIQINQIRDRLRMEKVFGLGVLTTILISFFILLGIKKTLKE